MIPERPTEHQAIHGMDPFGFRSLISEICEYRWWFSTTSADSIDSPPKMPACTAQKARTALFIELELLTIGTKTVYYRRVW